MVGAIVSAIDEMVEIHLQSDAHEVFNGSSVIVSEMSPQ